MELNDEFLRYKRSLVVQFIISFKIHHSVNMQRIKILQ